MSKKEELIEIEGVVLELLPRAEFRIKLDNGHEIIAYTAGKMRKNRIRVLANDRVSVEISGYDLTRGRVVQRHKVKNKAIDRDNSIDVLEEGGSNIDIESPDPKS